MATLLQDTFTDSNGTDLEAHGMTVGGGWTTHAEGGIIDPVWDIQSNRAHPALATNFLEAEADAGQADVTLTLDLIVPNSTSYFGGATVRWTSDGNYWAVAIERDGSGTPYLAIYELASGTATLKAGGSGVVDVPGATNSTVTMTVTTSGNLISVSLNTAETTSYSSSLYNTATRFGLWGYNGLGYTGIPIDNFLVESSGGGGAGDMLNNRLLMMGVG
jgi:hypothetical protein